MVSSSSGGVRLMLHTRISFGLVALIAVVLVVRTKIHPVFILIGGAAVGVAVE